MTLSPNRFVFGRVAIFMLALLYTGLTFTAATSPVSAKAKGPYYTAELVQPASENKVIARGVAWKCSGTTCRAGKGTSRPIRVCRGLTREIGEVKSFTSRGKALAEDKLAKCNGK